TGVGALVAAVGAVANGVGFRVVGDGVVQVAVGGRDGAGGKSAGAVASVDREAEFVRGEAAEFVDFEEVAAVVGEQPVEQGAGFGGQLSGPVGRHDLGAIQRFRGLIGLTGQGL